MYSIISVFIGGGLGAVLRYLTGIFSQKYLSSTVLGTITVNIIGCFLIGCILGYTINKDCNIAPTVKLFLTVGLLGGLTTFSTFSAEAILFLKDGKFLQALSYIFLSVFVGLLFTYIGYTITK